MCETWTATYHDAEAAIDSSQSPAGIAVSRDGSTVFAAAKTTTGVGFDSKSTWAMLAYDGSSGAPLWETKWGDPTRYSFPTSVAAGRNGLVFATGTTRTSFGDPDGLLTTIAFDQDTGEIIWRSTYNGPGGTDNARTLDVSPDGRTLYIAGISAGTSNADLDYALIAYDTATGRELFVTRYTGVGKSDSPFGLAVAPSGDLVYLTGWSYGHGDYNVDYGTVAIHTAGPAAGQIAWEARYDGTNSRTPDQANAIAIAPDGTKLYVTGLTSNATSGPPFPVDYSYGTVAYDARTGEQLWDARTKWDGTVFNSPNAIVADGSRVFVTGQTKLGSDNNVGTVAYDSSTGEQLWSESYGVAEHDLELGKAIAMSPRGEGVYVTGVSSSSRTKQVFLNQTQSGDQLTIGYDPATGNRDFVARFNSTGYDYDVGHDAVVSRDGSMLYLTSALKHNIEWDGNFYDSGLLAYRVGDAVPPPPDQRPTTTTFSAASTTTVQHSDDARFEVSITDDGGDPVSAAEVTVTIDAPEPRSFTVVTGEDGRGSVTTPMVERPGTYGVRAVFAGDADRGASEGSMAIEVRREDTSLTLTASGNGNHKVLTARLVDADAGSGVGNRVVGFSTDGEPLGAATTDASGTATYPVPPGARGAKETFEALFEGDDYFAGSAASTGPPPKPYV